MAEDLENPYAGLRPFREADRARFFGQTRLANRILNRLEIAGLAVVTGPSGAGATSLVQAKVVPEWRASHPGGHAVTFRPGKEPVANLGRALTEAGAAQKMEDETDFAKLGRTFLSELSHHCAGPKPWLLVIDAFEEIFLAENGRGQTKGREIAATLVDAVRGPGKAVKILLVLRDDFLGELRSFPELARLTDGNLCRVFPPTKAELREMIVAPARSQGVSFESGLVSNVLDELRGTGKEMLPLLQYALTRLWEASRKSGLEKGGKIKLATYREIGGVQTALALRASQVFQGVSRDGQRRIRAMLMSLVEFYESDGATLALACPATRLRLVERGGTKSGELLKLLIDEGFLVSLRNGESVELGHEVLTRAWAEFAEWIEDAREATQLRNSLARSASRWRELKQSWRLLGAWAQLWRGGRLLRALEFQAVPRGATRHSSELSRTGALSQAEERFLATAQRVSRRTWTAIFVFGGALVLTTLIAARIASRAIDEMRNAVRERELAQIQVGESWLARSRLAANCGKELEAGFLAGVATGFDGAASQWQTQQPAKPGRSTSPNGGRVAQWFDTGTERLRERWPRAAWILRRDSRSPPLSPSWLTADAAPEKHREAMERMAGAAKPFVWSSPFQEGSAPVVSVAFHPDGRTLAAGSADGLVRLWDAGSGREIAGFSELPGAAKCLAFDGARNLLAAASPDGSVKVWKLETREAAISLPANEERGGWVGFQPDGRLFRGSEEGRVTVWNQVTGGLMATLPGKRGPVRCLAVAPGGNVLASGEPTGAIRLCELTDGRDIAKLTGHRSEVRCLCFSPDGKLLASSDAGGIVKCWDIHTATERWTAMVQGEGIQTLAFDPTGCLLAGGVGNGVLRLWEVTNGQPAGIFPGHSGPVHSIAFSPDGSVLASGGEDRTVKLWLVRGTKSFDWSPYVQGGWVHWNEDRQELDWAQKPGGLAFSDRNIPPESWLGLLRQGTGPEQTNQLLAASLKAKNWEAAALLRDVARGAGGEGRTRGRADSPVPRPTGHVPRPGLASPARELADAVRDAIENADRALGDLRLKQGDALFPGDPDWALLRAGMLEREGQRKAALVWYRKINEIRGWRGAARLTQGSEAMELWRKILASPRDKVVAEDYRLAGNQAVALGDKAAARKIFGEGLNRFGNDAQLQVSFGTALGRFGDAAAARDILEKALARLEKSRNRESEELLPKALSELGSILGQLGKMEDAWAAYQRALLPPADGSTLAAPEAEKATAELLAGAMYVGMVLGRPETEEFFIEAKDRAAGAAERAMVMERRGWGLLAQGRAGEAYEQFGQAQAECEFDDGDSAITGNELVAGLAAAGWLTGSKGAALDEFENLLHRKDGKQWLKPGFLEGLSHLPREGVDALLAIREAWRERGLQQGSLERGKSAD